MFNPNTTTSSSKAFGADNNYCCDGILSANSTINPDFSSWNLVFVGYCDGSSFSGDRAGSYNGLRYRGRANLDAVLDNLLTQQHMSSASDVLITGGSAGGLAVYLHADHIAGRLPATANVKALAE